MEYYTHHYSFPGGLPWSRLYLLANEGMPQMVPLDLSFPLVFCVYGLELCLGYASSLQGQRSKWKSKGTTLLYSVLLKIQGHLMNDCKINPLSSCYQALVLKTANTSTDVTGVLHDWRLLILPSVGKTKILETHKIRETRKSRHRFSYLWTHTTYFIRGW